MSGASLVWFGFLWLPSPARAVELTADDAALLATRAAPSVLQADTAADQARGAVALGAFGFVPRVDLRAGYTRLSEIEPKPLSFGGVEIENPFPILTDTYTSRATVTLPLTGTFLTTLPTFQAARNTATALEYQEEATLQAVALQARQTFYGAVRARAAAEIADHGVEILEAHIADLEVLVSANLATRADLLAARAQLAEARAQQVARRGGAAVSEDSLRILLDLPASEPIGLTGTAGTGEVPELDRAGMLTTALSERPEVRALRALVKAQQANVRATVGGQFPAISAFADADYANPNQRIIPSTDEFAGTWDAGVVVTWSPTDAVGRGVLVGRAKVQVSQARSDLEALNDRIAIEVSQATNDLAVAVGTLTAAREGLVSATEAFRVRTELLGAGEATPAELLDSEAALIRAQLAESDARIGIELALARVQHVIGRAAPPASGDGR